MVTQLAAKLVFMLTPDKAEITPLISDSNLLDYGYNLKPLWNSLSPLSPSVLDMSIIIPCYNAEKYVNRLLDSALNQRTSYSYEVIAIDDGSVDKTLQILEEYASRYQNLVVLHQTNAGISMARNKGIEMAKGEYIGFADNDDALSTDYVEVLLKKARQYDADMVQGGYTAVFPDGKEKSCVTPEMFLEIDDETNRWRYVSGYMWRSVYRKSCFDVIRFPEHFWFEDMICRLALMQILHRVVIIKEIVYIKYYREDSEGVRQQSKIADLRGLDQYWLAKSLVELTTKQLGFPVNDFQYRQLLSEWSNLFWQRTRKLDRVCRKAVFQLASAYLNELQYECRRLTVSERFQEKALKRGNFVAWELYTISRIALKSKDQIC